MPARGIRLQVPVDLTPRANQVDVDVLRPLIEEVDHPPTTASRSPPARRILQRFRGGPDGVSRSEAMTWVMRC